MLVSRCLRIALAPLTLSLCLASCGGGSPSSPSASSGSSGSGGSSGSTATCGGATVGPLGCAKGLMTGTIAGAAFTGGVPTGASTYTPVAAQPALGRPALDFIVIQGTSADLTSLTLTARAKLGIQSLGAGATDSDTRQPTLNNAALATRANGTATGQWNTNILGGAGTITLTAVSTAGATGSYSLTMLPQAGSGATGNRVVEGSFTVTF